MCLFLFMVYQPSAVLFLFWFCRARCSFRVQVSSFSSLPLLFFREVICCWAFFVVVIADLVHIPPSSLISFLSLSLSWCECG